ncbi:MAG: hypothetical protein ACPG7F_21640, partial [Aggregatilineales bacterium]
MIERIADLLENRFKIPQARTRMLLQRSLVTGVAALFVLCATGIIAFDDIFGGLSNDISALEPGSRAPADIDAPLDMTFISDVLTDEAREQAVNTTDVVYYAPAPEISRQQTDLARQILAYMEDVRRDPYGEDAQKLDDLSQINALNLETRIAELLLKFDDETWTAIQSEVIRLLPFVMSQSIREGQVQLQTIRSQLPVQVNINLNAQPRDAVVDIVDDLILPNTFENVEETQLAQQRASDAVTGVARTFVSGRRIVDEGQEISEADYEALQALGVLKTDGLRSQEVLQAFLVGVLILVISSLYIMRFSPRFIHEAPQMLLLVASIFLLTLFAMRVMDSYIYLFPAAAMALLLVTITDPHVALISSLSLAFGGGIMAGTSLEIAMLIAAGSVVGILMLRRAERLNSFFVAGGVIAIINIAVVGVFNIVSPSAFDSSGVNPDILGIFLMVAVSASLLVPAAAITIMYAISMAFNLP